MWNSIFDAGFWTPAIGFVFQKLKPWSVNWLYILFLAMPTPPCQKTVGAYIEQFDKFPSLRENGFSFLIDASGSLFKRSKPNLKDVESNIQVLGACMLSWCLRLLFRDFLWLCDSCFLYLLDWGGGSCNASYFWPWEIQLPPAEACHHGLLRKEQAMAKGNSSNDGLHRCLGPKNGISTSTAGFLAAVCFIAQWLFKFAVLSWWIWTLSYPNIHALRWAGLGALLNDRKVRSNQRQRLSRSCYGMSANLGGHIILNMGSITYGNANSNIL